MRTWKLIAAAALVAGLGATAAVWFRVFYEPDRPLEPAWDAVVSTIAGGGAAGSSARSAFGVRFADPFGIAVATDGAIYVADGVRSHRIFRLTTDGAATVLAGGERGFADGAGNAARFDTPSGIAIGGVGDLFVADTGNDAIRRIAPDGTVSTVAGPGAGLNGPVGVAVDASGRVLVADTYNDRIVAIELDGSLSLVAGGSGPGFADGARAAFDTPSGVAVGPSGAIYVADTGNGAVRIIAPDGLVSTLGGRGAFGHPLAVAVAGGSVFVADADGRIAETTADLGQRHLAGSRRGFADGPGAEARFRAPSGIAVAAPGHLLVTDRRNGLVRRVTARSQQIVRAPAPPMTPGFDAQAMRFRPLLWPFSPIDGPFEVTGTLGEPRGVEGAERLHAGLDVYAVEGATVHVVHAAAADDPLATSGFDSINESVRIDAVAYVHLRVGRDRRGVPFDDDRFVASRDAAGKVSGVRVKRGARFAAGDALGTVNRFYHAHLNVGWPGEEWNPLRFGLLNFVDTVAPVIAARGIRLVAEDGEPVTTRRRNRVVVDQRVRVVVDAWDQVDGNLPRRRLGLYRLGYQVLDASGVPVAGFDEARETIRFDRLPSDADAARVLYAAGSGIPAYGRRSTRFLYSVTSTLQDGVAADSVLDLSALPPGDYTLRILAADASGNEAVRNRDLAITIS